jgi:glucosamine--fructose-6-phosphate aminotransferase (isomerizing)
VEPVDGLYGVGHTRWATHGRPTEENAHPHRDCTGRIVVVHNGIIENYLELKKELQSQGHEFKTETDTEIVAHLVEREMRDDGLENAVRRALTYMRGMFAIVLVSVEDPEKIVAVRNGPPIVVGLGKDEFFVASDIPAILAHTRDVVFLGDEEMAVITRSGVQFTDYQGRAVSKTTQRVLWDPIAAEKGGHKHFMLKEIYEQPTAARDTILGRVSLDRGQIFLEDLNIPDATLRALQKVSIIACGTSWHAGLVGKYLIEALAQIPVEVDYGSEYRYRNPIVASNELAVVITQSGETADTLAALREAKRKGAHSIAICNVVGSMATREAEGTVYTHAGPKSGWPPPRRSRRSSWRCSFSPCTWRRFGHTHLGADPESHCRTSPDATNHRAHDQGVGGHGEGCRAVLQPIRFSVSGARHQLSDCARRRAEVEGNLVHPRRGLSRRRDEAWTNRAHRRNDAGRRHRAERSRVRKNDRERAGSESPRRICYRVDDGWRCADGGGARPSYGRDGAAPCDDSLLTPVVMTVPLQLLAYHIAVRRGCDVDQPRNLAKSVTVE